MPIKGKSVKVESRFDNSLGLEVGKSGYKISFIVIVAQLCEYIKIIEWYTLEGELHVIWII